MGNGPGTWLTSYPEALGTLEFEEKNPVNWDLNSERECWDSSLEEGSRFLVSPKRDQLGSTKCAARLLKKLFLSLLMSKNLKLKKVNKSFVPEPISCFSDSLCLFHVFISWSISWTYMILHMLFGAGGQGMPFMAWLRVWVHTTRETAKNNSESISNG